AGRRVLLALPAANAAELPPALAAEFATRGIEVVAAAHVDALLDRLGMTLPVPKAKATSTAASTATSTAAAPTPIVAPVRPPRRLMRGALRRSCCSASSPGPPCCSIGPPR